MRPLRLDMHGFTVFRQPTTLDFTDVDFFALVGPTGSGKSTVLDAICFALYGTVPRWGDRRRIEHALAPSSGEARVRLVFEASGARFVATRVIRRDGKGKVATTHAGLEQLPAGFDLTAFDAAPAERGEAGLGVVLAGTPAEMDDAVAEAVGLPYEQFTSCVVLPQGEFARFLHAKPAQRQEILVNLLGLHVYQRIGERAGILHREAEARTAAARSLLADLSDADEAAQRAAEQSLDVARQLVIRVEAELPALAEAATTGARAQSDLAQIERETAALAAIRVPAAAATLAKAVESANAEAEAADKALVVAEEREEKLRAELGTAGDRAALQRVVDAHVERARLTPHVTELAAALAAAEKEHAKVQAVLASARQEADKANHAVAEARHGIEVAQTADRAAALRAHLVAGQPCPVCERKVTAVPLTADRSGLAAAKKRLATVEKAQEVASRTVERHDGALRQLERGLAAVSAQHEQTAKQLASVEARVAEAPALSIVEAGLSAIAAAEEEVARAGGAVRAARQADRAAAVDMKNAEDRMRRAWREYEQVRDGLAAFGPPARDHDDLVGSWAALGRWAEEQKAERNGARAEVLAVAEAALTTMTRLVAHLDTLFREAGVATVQPSGDPSAYRQTAALAVERATAAKQRVVERREQAARLVDQIAEHERDARIAKALAQHLRADRFERWLLAEALDALVAGASRILRELTADQYDLAHDKGELFVIDHGDAGLRRGVRTLSGGETFQASLALALALSEQLAGLSTAAASLESIMLDEGFGTLDSATLDTVAATLENLASRGDRMVGVVTHVSALADRIPVRFEVIKDARGVATVRRYG